MRWRVIESRVILYPVEKGWDVRKPVDPVEWKILRCTHIKLKPGYCTLSPVHVWNSAGCESECESSSFTEMSADSQREFEFPLIFTENSWTLTSRPTLQYDTEEREIWTLIDRGLYKNKKMIELNPAYPSTHAQRKPPRVLSHFWSQYPHSSHSFRSRTPHRLIDCSLVN